ncbi:MAG TPA: HAMP domain-containing sensor histidine kinase [Solirubrobacteraceae bacterium]|nr:HAMP domain-containing sensor histidine kinase [Solirubrobacteraceae bacterium]
MRSRLRSAGLRGRLLAAVLLSVTGALAVTILAFNVFLDARLSSDANNLLHSRVSAELSTLQVVDGRLVAVESPDDAALDSQVWVFAGTRALEHPRVPARLDGAASGLVGGKRRTLEVGSTRLYAVPVVRRGRRLGTVVAGVSLQPYQRTARIALVSSIILGLIVLAGVTLLARWLVGAALRPVAEMTQQAAEWSEHDLDRRFGLGEPRDELTELAATLDRLLERLAAGLRHEQRFSAELSHELRTPLSRLSARAELALRHPRDEPGYRESLTAILEDAAQMTRAVDALVAAARSEAGPRGTSDARAAADRAVSTCAPLAERRNVALELDAPAAGPRVGVDADLIERILSPLVENACRYGDSSVRVSVRADDGVVVFDVIDDGPGVDAADAERIFEPGVRGAAAGNGQAGAGAGLGLSLARRLAHAADGTVSVEPGPGGRFRVRLPVA